MAHVVFLRAVNVGGHQAFSPAALARELAALDVTNIGAAGTFIVHGKASAAAVKKAFADALAFETEIMVRPAKEVADLVARDPFGELPEGAKAFVSVLASKPMRGPHVPLREPNNDEWVAQLLRVDGHFALSLTRSRPGKPVDLSKVLQKHLGVSATTRGWPTILRVAKAL